jgi:hypothetical protein
MMNAKCGMKNERHPVKKPVGLNLNREMTGPERDFFRIHHSSFIIHHFSLGTLCP